MKDDFYNIILYVLIFSTILFILVSIKVLFNISKKQKLRELIDARRFYETKKGIDKIDLTVKNTFNLMSSNILPKIDTFYEHFKSFQYFNIDRLKELLKSVLAGEVAQLPDLPIIFFGIETDFGKVSFLSLIDEEEKLLKFRSFSFYFNKITKNFLVDILESSQEYEIGSIGLKKYKEKYVFLIDYSINFKNTKINENIINNTIDLLLIGNDEIKNIGEKNKLEPKELLFNDFLINESEIDQLEKQKNSQ